ncbi:flagellar biosynthetic protein FliO, partial [Terrihabitans sp. PJ23]
MGFLDQIFGTSLPVAVRFLIAFGIVLGLIALTAWAVRRLAGRRLPVANQGRARQPRLGVLDAFAIDARRRLVLIRRDNVEHLIMIGGPNDLVVESNIVRAPSQGLPAPQQRTGRAPDVDTGRPVVPQAADPEFPQGNAPQIPPANQQRTASPPPRPAAAPPVVRTPMPAPVATAPEPPQAPPTA